MERFDYVPNQLPRVATVGTAEQVSAFLRVVYGWMCVGLGITASVAWVVAGSPGILLTIAQNRPIFWALIIAQLGIVFVMSARVDKLSPTTAAALFVAYSGLTGVTMAFVLLAYTGASVASTFVVTAGMFGSMALYGTLTTRSLAGWGQFLFMGLVGVVLASIVGIFWQSSALQFVISFCGVIVFTGLTAYDAQRMRNMAVSLPDGRVGAYGVVGALALYLDFVNLFLMLLRLFGGRRD
jgi:uncharacterized protein